MNPRDRFDSLIAFYADNDQTADGNFVARATPVPFDLLKRQLLQESAADPDAVSRVGAKGLAQAMDKTWQEWVRNEFGGEPPPHRHVSPFDPEEAIRFQADYLTWLLKALDGDTRKAIAAYNAGIGRVTALVKEHGASWEQHLPDETKDYLKKILG